MTNDSQISALERLTKLRDNGVLTEEEFAREKAKVLAGPSGAGVPFYRRLWFVVLLTCLILTFPLALIILATGDVYKSRQGELEPISATARKLYAGALGVWLIAAIIYGYRHPPEEGGSTAQTVAASSPEAVPMTCDSSGAADMVKRAIEGNATSGLVQMKVLDFGNAREVYFDRPGKFRYCRAQAEINTGASMVSYKFYFGPSGSELVEVREVPNAYRLAIEDAQLAAMQEAARRAPAPSAPPATEGEKQPTSAQCELPEITEGSPYSELRQSLVAQGFSPNASAPSDGSYCSREYNAAACQERPEVEDCASGGQCKMLWAGPGGAKLDINIFGDGPNDPAASVTGKTTTCE